MSENGLLAVTIGVILVAATNTLAPKMRLAAPILLVVVGIIGSFLPVLNNFEVEPHIILTSMLPPLLYAAAVSMPAMDFRREFFPVSALSIVLVVVSAFVLGILLHWILPEIDLWWCVALGAVISPTDAAATAIARGANLKGRLISILEGESLLNDATALVLLHTAVSGASSSVSLSGAVGQFFFSVIVATIIGLFTGRIFLMIRSRVKQPAVSTVWSFVAPFVAALPAEHLGASGLVAAVVAGLVTGHGAIKWLDAEQRTSDHLTWKTIEVLVEGGIFLLLGLQLSTILEHVHVDQDALSIAILAALIAFVAVLVVRAMIIGPLMFALNRQAERSSELQGRIATYRSRIESSPGRTLAFERMIESKKRDPRMGRMRTWLADMDYYISQPLGEDAARILVWAGMRGAITLAAAQTLPADTPHRSMLILIAFLVATFSLLVQGLTLPAVVRRFAPKIDTSRINLQREAVAEGIANAAASVAVSDRQSIEDAQYRSLIEMRGTGEYDSGVLTEALNRLDAQALARQYEREAASIEQPA